MNLSFIIRLIIIAAIGYAGYYFLLPNLPVKLQYHHFLYILLFFMTSTTAFHFGLSKSVESGPKHFIRYYMAATGLKLLLYVAIIVMYAVINKAGMMAFAFCFLLFYVLFTILEVSVAYKQFGSNSKPADNGDQLS